MPSIASVKNYNATHVQGSAKLMDKLEKLPRKVADKAIRKGVRASGKIILVETNKNAPVDEGVLKKNLTVRATKPRGGGKIGIRVGYKSGDELVRVTQDGKRYFYPAAVEYGHGEVEGLHFQRDSFEATKVEATAKFASVVGTMIEQDAAK